MRGKWMFERVLRLYIELLPRRFQTSFPFRHVIRCGQICSFAESEVILGEVLMSLEVLVSCQGHDLCMKQFESVEILVQLPESIVHDGLRQIGFSDLLEIIQGSLRCVKQVVLCCEMRSSIDSLDILKTWEWWIIQGTDHRCRMYRSLLVHCIIERDNRF